VGVPLLTLNKSIDYFTYMKNQNLENTQLVEGGPYEHYKGKPYRVHGTVRHSETLEELVLYETLYQNDLGKMWVRPKKMFLETVEIGGKVVPRFKFVGKE
jgi:hypothetical protein